MYKSQTCEISHRRNKTSLNSYNCFRYILQSTRTEPIEPILHSPGLYFDPTSVAYFYNDYWHVVTHIEIIPIKPYLTKIEQSILSMSQLCVKAQNIVSVNIDCKDVINPLEILINANNLKYDSLSHLISENYPNRFKRSLEFGGEILKFFFGTLDADDARKYDEAIKACQQNENEIFSLMKDNIHVVQSTINNFNVSILKLSNNEIRLNKQIEKLNYIFTENSKTSSNLINVAKINSIFSIIEGSLLSVSNILDTILNSILFAKANILHPYVLTPTKLYNELSNSKLSKKYREFPVMLSLENIHTIIDLAKLTSYYYNNKIIFVMKIPLINPVKFSIYKNLPLPISKDEYNLKSYVLIYPSKPYIALTDDRLNYALLDNLNECKNVNSEYEICPLPAILSTINNPTCESKLLTEVTLSLPDICDLKIIYGIINIWQKLNDGRYIYVQSKANKLTVKCSNNDEIKDYTLQGTGILSLKNDCVAYFQTLQFYPTHNYKTVLPNQLSIDFNIVEDDCCKYKIVNNTYNSITPISLSNIDLESLKLAYHKLDNLKQQIHQVEKQSHIVKYGHFYSTITYVIIVIIFAYIIYKLYKKCLTNKNRKTSCCIQIYNQCFNKKSRREENKVSTSVELSELSSGSTECDRKSIKSLPEIEMNKNKVMFRSFIKDTSSRNLSNY